MSPPNNLPQTLSQYCGLVLPYWQVDRETATVSHGFHHLVRDYVGRQHKPQAAADMYVGVGEGPAC